MLANNILTINHLLKILGSFCAEDFQQFIDYKTLSDQPEFTPGNTAWTFAPKTAVPGRGSDYGAHQRGSCSKDWSLLYGRHKNAGGIAPLPADETQKPPHNYPVRQ